MHFNPFLRSSLYLASTVRMTEVNLKRTTYTYGLIFFSDT
jgi:hypothetical protein